MNENDKALQRLEHMTEDQLQKRVLKMYTDLMDSYENAVEDSEEHLAESEIALSMLYQERGVPKDALKIINKVLKKQGVHTPFAWQIKAEILRELEKPKEALISINKSIDGFRNNYGEDLAGNLVIKADAYHDLGKFKLAINCNLKATQMFKKQKIVEDDTGETLGDALWGIGHNYFHLNKNSQSLKWLEKAEKTKNILNSGQVAFDKAQVLIEMKKYDQALKEARKAIKLDPGEGEYWLLLSYCLVLAKKGSFDVLRAIVTSETLMPKPSTHRAWNKEVKIISRYLKNADEGEIAKSAIKLKKRYQNLKLNY